eukprot:TRINITY_DN864_c0_g3_i1.p1 TRINITY_DN864_c0_g3~~TRINITY_DN864_c0_g3_i1.p1  ORF type:complete len:217 (-),score=37.30 TRINITY_DN864_c0_g3_i1:213-863(-)
MSPSVALLRAINVSGKNKLPMSELKTLFEEAKCTNIRTYINSGNVVFNASEEVLKTLDNDISTAIRNKYGYEVPVIVRSFEEIQQLVTSCPYNTGEDEEDQGNEDKETPTTTATKTLSVTKTIKKKTNKSSSTSGQIFVYFLSKEASSDSIDQLDTNRSPPDKFQVQGKNIYLCLQSAAKTKLSTSYFDSKLGGTSTARNWKTVTALVKLMSNPEI